MPDVTKKAMATFLEHELDKATESVIKLEMYGTHQPDKAAAKKRETLLVAILELVKASS